MGQIIAMHNAKKRCADLPESINLLVAAWIICFEDDDEDRTRLYRVEGQCADGAAWAHMWNGCDSTEDFAAALAVFRDLVTAIDASAEYGYNRNQRAENTAFF
ncbi:hypothetical protein N7563_22110 [Leclercia adecarboxylata ATCC 23216 = NBRC 102595]|nr:hypothetical protein [Leclercia adecarboxylata ATCC 23216 = NBRC 102595]